VLPQIVPVSLPGLVNEMSLLIKVTPVLAVVGVVDITRAAVRIGQSQTYEPLRRFSWRRPLCAIVFALVSLSALESSGARPPPRLPYDPRFRRRLERTCAAFERARQYGDIVGAGCDRRARARRRPDTRADVTAGPVAIAARTFVDGMRCVPFLLFAYIGY